MNILQGLESRHTFCVTLNATEHVDPARVLARLHYDHPLFTPAGVAAQQRHGEVSGAPHARDPVGRTHYCGAYWRYGFHEDGVVSARMALDRFAANARCTARSTSGRLTTGGTRRVRMRSATGCSWPISISTRSTSCFAEGGCWSTTRAALARFDRRDHLGDPGVPLDESVRALVTERTGRRPEGPDPPAHAPRLLRVRLQSGQLLLLLRRGRPAPRGRRRGGRPTRRGASVIATCFQEAGRARTCRSRLAPPRRCTSRRSIQ